MPIKKNALLFLSEGFCVSWVVRAIPNCNSPAFVLCNGVGGGLCMELCGSSQPTCAKDDRNDSPGREGRRVPTKKLFEQETPKIGTQKCSTKRGVQEPLHG